MEPGDATILKSRALAAAGLLALAVPLGVVWALGQSGREVFFAWAAVGAAAAGAALVAFAAGRHGASWFAAAAAVPAAFLVLASAPNAASLEALPVARFAVAAAAVIAYVAAALPLARLEQYAAALGTLGAGAMFFTLWEPPPPTPVPIAKHLKYLESGLVDQLNAQWKTTNLPGAWTATSRRLTKDVEQVLGADEYLNLDLEPPAGGYRVLVFVTYNANAMTNVPHVPWVCMTQSGYELLTGREDKVMINPETGKEIGPNVLLFDGGEKHRGARALMFQYFRVGETYTPNRQIARFLATSGSLGHSGSFLSQTQVAVWLPEGSREDPLDKSGEAYRLGVGILNVLVPLLERDYYPNLRQRPPLPQGAQGG
jgi:hypothetical protein